VIEVLPHRGTAAHADLEALVAQLEPAGLTYSVGRTITFVPRAQLNLSLR